MTTTPELNEDFRDILAELVRGGVEFIVVGAHALALHGAPRATGDLDVFVRPSRENAERVMQALVRFGAPVESHGVTVNDLAREGTVYQLGLPPRRIDLLTAISGVGFEEAWAAREERDVEGLPLSFLGRAQLIANKRASARPKDLRDLEMLDEAEAEATGRGTRSGR
jgi:hypothetical protein